MKFKWKVYSEDILIAGFNDESDALLFVEAVEGRYPDVHFTIK